MAFSRVKSWLKKNRTFAENCNNPKYPLLLALSQVTPDMASIHETEIKVILTFKIVEIVKINFDFKLQKLHGHNNL